VFDKQPGGFQSRRVDAHHREFLVDLRCPHNDLRARYIVRASGTLAPTGVEGSSRYRDIAIGCGLMLATTE
jgi:hypothetical protein